MDIKYMDTMTGENFVNLLTFFLAICSTSRRGDEVKGVDNIVILGCCEFHFIEEHENLM